MITPKIVPNTTRGNCIEEHTFEVHGLCPVSKNPMQGSTITISYQPHGQSLEIASLFAYIHQFRGGLRDEEGTLIVRDMESMLVKMADDCANALGLPVQVKAIWALRPFQEATLIVHACPAHQIGGSDE